MRRSRHASVGFVAAGEGVGKAFPVNQAVSGTTSGLWGRSGRASRDAAGTELGPRCALDAGRWASRGFPPDGTGGEGGAALALSPRPPGAAGAAPAGWRGETGGQRLLRLPHRRCPGTKKFGASKLCVGRCGAAGAHRVSGLTGVNRG